MGLRYLLFGAQILATAALLAVLFASFNWPSFLAMMERVPLSFYWWSLALLFVAQIPYALKWGVVLGALGIRISVWRVFEQYMIALFFANFLPSAVGGDASKVYYMGQRSGYLSVGVSVLMDRGITLLSVIVLATISSWLLEVSSPVYYLSRQLVTLCLFGGVGAFLLVMFVPLPRWLSAERLSGWIGEKWARRVETVIGAIRQLGRSPWVIACIMLVVLVYYSILAVIYREFFAITTAADLSPLTIMTALFGITVLSHLPVTINGIGLREQLHYVLFSTVGVPKEASVGISLLMFSQVLVLSLLGFLLWLRLHLRRQLASRRAAREHAAAAASGPRDVGPAAPGQAGLAGGLGQSRGWPE